MDLLILGKTNDDKGAQLERLTKYLLGEMEYTDIVVNQIGAGGHEIDVRAERRFPSLGGGQRCCVICECKAHKTPISMSDWLKFLGKIFVEEARLKRSVYGCFISLSGVNGAVAGNYDELRENKDEIELITGDDLVRLLSKTFDIIQVREIDSWVRGLTSRQIIRIALCYYSQRIYWLVEFEGGAFSLLSHEGRMLATDGSQELQSLLVDNTDVREFVDLQAEAEARHRATSAEKIVLSALMLLGGRGSCEEVLGVWLDNCPDEDWRSFSTGELSSAAERLAGRRILDIDESGQLWDLLPDQSHEKTERTVGIYKHFLQGETLISAIGCSFYDEHIDMALLDKICEIQGGIELPEERKQDYLKLLRWSPEALAWSLHPDPMIVKYRKRGQITQRMEQNDVSYFKSQLLNRFAHDFDKGPLTRYFHSIRNLREVDTKRRVEIKGTEASELVLELRSRLGIEQAGESLGGGIARIYLLEDSPEPWEWRKIGSDTSAVERDTQIANNDGTSTV